MAPGDSTQPFDNNMVTGTLGGIYFVEEIYADITRFQDIFEEEEVPVFDFYLSKEIVIGQSFRKQKKEIKSDMRKFVKSSRNSKTQWY